MLHRRPFPNQSNAIVVCVADDLFQSCHPGDFYVSPTIVCGCSTYCLFTNWRNNATKLYLFLDDIFQPSSMLFGVCVADDLFQSSPAIVEGVTANCSGQRIHSFRRNNYASVIVPANVIFSGRVPPKKRKGKAVIVIRYQLKLPLVFPY